MARARRRALPVTPAAKSGGRGAPRANAAANSGGRSAPPAKPTAMWGGRFREPADLLLRRLNDSFSFDVALIQEDVRGSRAWAEALRDARVLSRSEWSRLDRGLREIAGPAGTPATPERSREHEDVHSFVEAELAARVGPLAGKLHTGRSRNDQVATDLRLYLMDAFREAFEATLGLAAVLADRAAAEAFTVMPGYTHLKRAVPITFGHWCLAYTEMLLRDADRFADARGRADECPLGSGALA